MPTEAASIDVGRRLRLAGDILWLGISAGVCALIVGIVCWSLSAERSPGAAAGRPTATVTPETNASSAAVSLPPTGAVNRIPSPDLSSTTALSGGLPATAIAPPTEHAGIKSPLRDPTADQLPTPALANERLAPAPSKPQPAQSATVSQAAHGVGPHRPSRHKQRGRPAPPRTGTELVPW